MSGLKFRSRPSFDERPRIATVEDADAAPVGTVALNADRSHVWQKTDRVLSYWQSLTGGAYSYTADFVRDEGPLTVIATTPAPSTSSTTGRP